MSTIQAALEAQKRMLAAKAGGMPGGITPPPDPVDPSVTLALAKARAAALMTCQDAPPAAPPPPDPMAAIANAKAMLQQSMQPQRLPAEPLPGTLLLGKAPAMQSIGGALGGGLGKGPGFSSLSGFGGGRPPWGAAVSGMRPPMRGMGAGGGMGPHGMMPPVGLGNGMNPLAGKGMPKIGAEQFQGSLSSKGRPSAPPPGLDVPKAPALPPANLGNLAAMKEVSPALAALMQGGLV